MDYLAQSIEKARLQAAEEDFNTCFGGSNLEEMKEETQEETCTGSVFVGSSFENVPPNLENLKKKAAS